MLDNVIRSIGLLFIIDLMLALILGVLTDCITLSLQIRKNHSAPAPATIAVNMPMPINIFS